MTDDEVEQCLLDIRKLVRQIAKVYFADDALVDEAVQEHALDCWQVRKQADSAQDPRRYFINRAHYVCLRLRQARYTRQVELESVSEVVEPPAGNENSHLRDLAVRQAFDSLPSHLWAVAWLVHGEGFLVSETAKRLGLPRLLAEQRLGEATARLQALLKGWR